MGNLRVVQRGQIRDTAQLLRGSAVAATSVTMAVAAHAGSGGEVPQGAATFLLLGQGGVLAVAASSVPGLRSGGPALLTILGTGQILAHLLLSTLGHTHGGSATTSLFSAGMLAAHLLAVGTCAVLIVFAERIGPRCSAALSRILPQPLVLTPVRAPLPAFFGPDYVPVQRSAMLACSLGRRGPPEW